MARPCLRVEEAFSRGVDVGTVRVEGCTGRVDMRTVRVLMGTRRVDVGTERVLIRMRRVDMRTERVDVGTVRKERPRTRDLMLQAAFLRRGAG